jgi:hypothetical protein
MIIFMMRFQKKISSLNNVSFVLYRYDGLTQSYIEHAKTMAGTIVESISLREKLYPNERFLVSLEYLDCTIKNLPLCILAPNKIYFIEDTLDKWEIEYCYSLKAEANEENIKQWQNLIDKKDIRFKLKVWANEDLRKEGICDTVDVPSKLEEAIAMSYYHCVDKGGCFEIVDEDDDCIYHCDSQETYLNMETYWSWDSV